MKVSIVRIIQVIMAMIALGYTTPAFADNYGHSSSAAAGSGVYLEVTGLPGYVSNNTANNSTLGGDTTAGSDLNMGSGFSYDLRTLIGYKFGSGLLVGANYNTANTPYNKTATASTSSEQKYTKSSEYGASIGYFSGQFRIIGSYLFAGTMDSRDFEADNTGVATVDLTQHNKGGTGYQVIMGYDIPLGTTLAIGPTLTYRSMTYTSQQATDNVNTGSYPNTPFVVKAVFNSFTPMVTISLTFN